MIKIGITGQDGFIGSHLVRTLGLLKKQFKIIPFKKSFFSNISKLQIFVVECDVIVHLAGSNRHESEKVLYKINIELTKKLIEACEKTESLPHILFSSSTQEKSDNLYGKSKIKSRLMFEDWAERNHSNFTGLIIPNVYGPFGKPYYNSVVATFCHQASQNKVLKIKKDGTLNLIYVGELVDKIIEIISTTSLAKTSPSIKNHNINYTDKIKVSSLLKLIEGYKERYFDKGEIPDLKESFNKNLWNTFLCYIDHKVFFPYKLNHSSDNRGSFVETIKLKTSGQVSFSTTFPGVTRGNHYHTRKSERFAVIKGKARIEIRKVGTDAKFSFYLDGDSPSFVDMPIWYTHNITNIGKNKLFTIFWVNEEYDENDPDTFFEEV